MSDTSIKITWTAPASLDGVAWYTATAKGGNTEQHCEAQVGKFSCEVKSLKPYTDYTVELVACDNKLEASSRNCSKVVTWKKQVKTLQMGKSEICGDNLNKNRSVE